MRFKLESTGQDVEELSSHSEFENLDTSEHPHPSTSYNEEETVYPNSISIDVLMKLGQLVKPRKKNRVSLTLDQEWVTPQNPLDLLVEADSFSSGGFEDAFLGTSKDKQF